MINETSCAFIQPSISFQNMKCQYQRVCVCEKQRQRQDEHKYRIKYDMQSVYLHPSHSLSLARSHTHNSSSIIILTAIESNVMPISQVLAPSMDSILPACRCCCCVSSYLVCVPFSISIPFERKKLPLRCFWISKSFRKIDDTFDSLHNEIKLHLRHEKCAD